ncbi:MAG: tetratricopeptide repeat protein [Verrucomicrobiota bacterium]|jgi:tetratricopeptide (TPR) repeat protein
MTTRKMSPAEMRKFIPSFRGIFKSNPLTVFKTHGLILTCILLAMCFAIGCKPKSSAKPGNQSAYFQTPFQTESQFIVDAVVADLAEQMVYAASHRLPDRKYFSVTATEKPGSPKDAPVYAVQIRLDPKSSDLKLEVNVNGPIWSPAVYQAVAEELARAVGLKAGNGTRSDDTTLLSRLTDGTPETIEQENQKWSAALEKDFGNPELHEKAAVLLGAFMLREHSGNFYEVRSPLSRLTAHLTMVRFLGGTNAYGINGRMAEAISLTLMGDQALALALLNGMDTNDVAVAEMVRALRTRNTGDYRTLDQMNGLSRIEGVEWFSAWADYVSAPIAWPKLNDSQQQTIDFVRAANQEGYSVEMGHQLLRVSIPLELQEIGSVYELSHNKELARDGLVKALNEMPERCFATATDGKVHVYIIGWGQWAMFLQRHLCHAVQQNYNFMMHRWGVPDDAAEFSAKCDAKFWGLRLYPFVRRFNCTNEATYHKSVDDGIKVTVATPHLVPAECWNRLWYRVSFADWYHPVPNLFLSEWHNHNPLPGTVYDLNPRLTPPGLTNRPDAVARFEQLHELAPYDCRIANFILTKKYTNCPTYDQAMTLYRGLLPYSVFALRTVACAAYKQPELYEKYMLQAAELNPACYYDLGDYALGQTNENKAAQYFDKAADTDPDSVRVANNSEWRVKYYLKKGQTDKARKIADFAAEVYSNRGLQAMGYFLEATTNYDQAYGVYLKIEERYDNPAPLLGFCARYLSKTGDRRFEPEAQKRIRKLFPKGIEKVSLNDFHDPPADGVLIKQENDLLKSGGMKKGDVIVAVYGVRVHNFRQYTYGRNLKNTPELELIVWQGDAYREFKPSAPDHQFGLDFGNYPPK